MKDFGWGDIFAVRASRYAQKACDDIAASHGVNNIVLELLASVGNTATNRQNAHRGITSHFCKDGFNELVSPIDGESGICNVMVYPHELVHLIHKHFPTEFEHRLGAKEHVGSWKATSVMLRRSC